MENPNTNVKVVAAGEALMDMIFQPDGSLMHNIYLCISRETLYQYLRTDD